MNMRKMIFLLALALAWNAKAQTDSLDLKIGQMIMIGYPDAAVNQSLLNDVRTGKVGSLLLYERNIPPTNSYAGLKKIIETYQKAAPLPLLITIDQEGGKVNRLKEKYGFPKSVSNAVLGKMGSLDSVRFYSECMAATLAGLGINMNLAPVADLGLNANNPVVFKKERAYSANIDTVIMMAKEMILAHHRYNVLTVLKHFPGSGSSNGDTHLDFAEVTKTWTEKEMEPFVQLINAGITDAILSSHTINRQLDKEGLPNTLSKSVLTDLLRKKLNYQGIVFSDDMQMLGIAKYYGVQDAIRMAINGGVDILTFSNNISGSPSRTVDTVHTMIKNMVLSGAISRARIDESFRRIKALKLRWSEGNIEGLKEAMIKQKQIILAQKSQLEKCNRRPAKERRKKKSTGGQG